MSDQEIEEWFNYLMDVEGKGSTDPYDSAHKNSDTTGRYTRFGISPGEQETHQLPKDFTMWQAKEYYRVNHWEPVGKLIGDAPLVCQWCIADVSVQSNTHVEYWHDLERHFRATRSEGNAADFTWLLMFLVRRSEGYQEIYLKKRNDARKVKNLQQELGVTMHYGGWTGRRMRKLTHHLLRGPLSPQRASSVVPVEDEEGDLTQEFQRVDQHVDQGEWQRLQRAKDQVKQEKAALDAHRYKVIEDIADAQRNAKIQTAPQLERSGPAPATQEKSTKKPPKWMRWLKAVGVGLGVAGVSVAGPAMDVAGPLIEAVASGASVKDAVIGGVAGWLFDRSGKDGR